MRFAITGATGFVGTGIRTALLAQGHEVTRVVRSFAGVAPGEKVVVWHPEQGTIERANLEGHDVVIHLAGESVAGVWTNAKKRAILESRKQATTLITETIAGLEDPPRTFFSASGFNIYGDRPPHEVVTEETAPGTGFLAEVAQVWESSATPAERIGVRVVHMRFGNVLHPSGGMLKVLLPLYRLGLGTRFGSGQQIWPWIAREDIPAAILHLLEHPDVKGPVNFSSPNPVSNEEFTKAIAAAVGRPTFLRVPRFAAKLAPGNMSEELLLAGARVVPRRLLDSGYTFRCPELRPALRTMLDAARGG
jgi:hypothetical protein